jgi:hypothetical protein
MFGMDASGIEFTQDEYSLNSVSGRVALRGQDEEYFFKFHQEEGEEEHVTEYYRAHLLSSAGLPVEVPVAVSNRPGAQIVLYRLRAEPRMADLCVDIERRRGQGASLTGPLAAARQDLDRLTGRVMVRTLSAPRPASAATALHQLFYHRLAGPGASFPGGRYRSFYTDNPAYGPLASLRWRVDGNEYAHSLAELAERASVLLQPPRLAALPVVTAHGDDHQGNVWALGRPPGVDGLRLFDPAFASDDIPALLAPVKATFHNALAHPFWLYHPQEVERAGPVGARVTGGVVDVTTGTSLSPLRRQVLDSAAAHVWAPLLAEMAHRGWLPADWRQTVRSALFCCPMLVTDLMSTTRPAPARWLGLARAVMAGSEPVWGADAVTDFLDRVTP